jgi:hypothetical protein
LEKEYPQALPWLCVVSSRVSLGTLPHFRDTKGDLLNTAERALLIPLDVDHLTGEHGGRFV